MSTEENKALIHRLVDNVANEGRFEELERWAQADVMGLLQQLRGSGPDGGSQS